MAVRMIGLDLDGTVLTEDKKVTDGVRSAIMQAAAAGIEVVPVTGRPFTGIPEEVREIPGIRYSVVSNGALAFKDDEELFGYFLADETAAFITRASIERGFVYSVFAGGMGYSDVASHERLMKHFEGTPLYPYLAGSRRPSEDIEQTLRANAGRIENIWVRTPDRETADGFEEEIQRAAGGHATTLRTLPMDVETVSEAADKGESLLRLGRMLGIPREEIMAVGDSENDIGLLRKAGIAVAMGNATEAVKKLCPYVTEDNEHDGVAQAIRRFAL